MSILFKEQKNNKKIWYSCLVLLGIALSYFLYSWLTFGEVKFNFIKMVTGEYYIEKQYSIADIINMSENVEIEENGTVRIYTINNARIVLEEAFEIKSVTIEVSSLEDVGANIFLYYGLNGAVAKNQLITIGNNTFNCGGSSNAFVVLSNIEGIHYNIQGLIVRNYSLGYDISVMSLFLFYFILLTYKYRDIFSWAILKNKIYDKNKRELIGSKKWAMGMYLCTILCVAIYIFFYLRLPHVFHAENYNDFPKFLNDPSESFLKNLLYKTFDLAMIEGGGYRPRALAFGWQYIETNFVALLNHYLPFWKLRLPFILFCIPLSIYGFGKLGDLYIKKNGKIFGWFIGSTILFLPSFQVSTYWFLRSAKLITPFLGICLIVQYFVIDNDILITKKNIIKEFLWSIGLFALCTFDEQLLLTILFLNGIFFLRSLKAKKIQIRLLTYSFALIQYIFFYCCWGKWLFNNFTSIQIVEHGQTFSMIFEQFSIAYFKEALSSFFDTIIWNVNNNKMLFSMLLALFIIAFINCKEKIVKIRVLFLLMFAFGLSLCIIIGLPGVYMYEDLQKGIYLLYMVLIIYFTYIYLVLNWKESKYTQLRNLIVAFFMLMVVVVSSMQIKKYPLIHLGIYGGNSNLRESYVDVECLNELYDDSLITYEQYNEYMEK